MEGSVRGHVRGMGWGWQGCQVILCQVIVKVMLVRQAVHMMLVVAVVVASASVMVVAALVEEVM